MKAPNLPSFFKSPKLKEFQFHARYYLKKEKKLKFKKTNKSNIKFDRISNPYTLKRRNFKIIFIIIILSLLAYILLK